MAVRGLRSGLGGWLIRDRWRRHGGTAPPSEYAASEGGVLRREVASPDAVGRGVWTAAASGVTGVVIGSWILAEAEAGTRAASSTEGLGVPRVEGVALVQ